MMDGRSSKSDHPEFGHQPGISTIYTALVAISLNTVIFHPIQGEKPSARPDTGSIRQGRQRQILAFRKNAADYPIRLHRRGTIELMNHRCTSLVIPRCWRGTGYAGYAAYQSPEKPVIYVEARGSLVLLSNGPPTSARLFSAISSP